MPITPLDVKKKTFSTQFRGLSPNEVKSFLDLVAREMEELRKSRALLAEKVDELSARIEQYERTEQLLQDTLVTAQKTTDELGKTAKEKAKALSGQAEQQAKEKVRNAEKQAEEIIRRAENQTGQLKNELGRLETEKSNLLHQIRGMAQSFLSMVEKWETTTQRGNDKTADSGKR